MPNEWDEFASPPQANIGPSNPWQDFATLDGGNAIPLEEETRRRALRERYRRRSLTERIRAGIQSTANSIPIVGERLSPSSDPLVQEFRENQPIASTATNIVGSGLPFLGLPGRAATAMFGSTPRSFISGATIGGADARSRGQDPVVGGGLGGLFAVGGRGLTRAATPRDPTHPEIVARRNPATRPPADLPEGYTAADFGAPTAHQEIIRRRISGRRVAEEQRQGRGLPAYTELPAWARGTIGAAGAGAANVHPVLGILAGLAAPRVGRVARNTTNRVAQSRTFDAWLNNQRLTPEQRAIASIIGLSVAPDPATMTGQ